MSQFASVLIYDGECPYCSVAARAVEQVQDIGAISWYDDSAQAFLEAHLNATPFAMVLVDATEHRVYTGRSAAEELTRRAGMPELVGSLVRENYDAIAGMVGRDSGRGREAADMHDQYALTAEGADSFEALAANAVDRDIRKAE